MSPEDMDRPTRHWIDCKRHQNLRGEETMNHIHKLILAGGRHYQLTVEDEAKLDLLGTIGEVLYRLRKK